MRRRMPVGLLIIGLTAACVFWLFFRGQHGALFKKEQTASVSMRRVPGSQPRPGSGVTHDLPPVQSQGAQANTHILHNLPITPTLNGLSVDWLLPNEKDPDTRALLEGGISKIRHNDYEAARDELQRLINKYPDTKFAAPAYWAIGLAFYMEGGEDNLREARDQFTRYAMFFASQRQYDDLTEAAQNNIAVINVQLMQLSGSVESAQIALNSIQTFLDRWPNSPRAPAAWLLLHEIQKSLNQP